MTFKNVFRNAPNVVYSTCVTEFTPRSIPYAIPYPLGCKAPVDINRTAPVQKFV
jgi:hypothetical protein